MGKFSEIFYQTTSRHKWSTKLLFCLVVALGTLVFYRFNIFERLELLTLDYRFLLRQPKRALSDIIFIDMEEDSIKTIGRWPWPRKWHATCVKALSEYGAKVVSFDVLFSEPQDAIDDSAFEESIRRSGTVYLPYMFELETQNVKKLYRGGGITSILWPIRRFRQEIKGTGFINAIPDQDGILRRIPPIVDYEGQRFYQLGFKIGCDILGLDEEDILFYPENHLIVLKKRGRDVKVPLDENNQLILNWQNRWGKAFEHISYIGVIKSFALIKEGKKPLLDLNRLRDKICVIGLTASGLIDIKPIPIENVYPAMGVHATLMENIFTNEFIHVTPRLFNTMLLFFISVVLTLYLSILRPLSGMYLALGCLILYSIFSLAMFSFFGIAIITFYPVFAIVFSYGLTATYTQLLQAVEQARLFKEATRDGLTHLYNVKHFTVLLETEFKHTLLYKNRNLAVIMIDLDNFKELNDTYGHRAGDTVLREIASIMRSKCRQIDVIARYGGEEFIVMLVGAGKGWAFSIAEKIRSAVEQKKFNFEGETYSITVSMGVAEYNGEDTKEELVEKADKALYKAKREGKNRVCVY